MICALHSGAFWEEEKKDFLYIGCEKNNDRRSDNMAIQSVDMYHHSNHYIMQK